MKRLEIRRAGALGTICAAGGALACSPLLDARKTTFTDQDSTPDARVATSSIVGAPLRLSPPSREPGTQFASTLDIQGDTIAVAAPFEDVETKSHTARRAGATYLFELASDASAPRRIVAANADDDDGVFPSEVLPPEFPQAIAEWPGLRLALGERSLIVGVPAEDSASTDPTDNSAPEAGAVYVYDRSSAAMQYVKAPLPSAGDVFGQTLALSEPLLVVGAPGTAHGSGTVYVYERASDGTFVFSTVIDDPAARAGDWFGGAVALAGDLLVVGAPGDDGVGTGVDPSSNTASSASQDSGSAYVFRSSGARFRLEHLLKPAINTVERGLAGVFGFSVAATPGRIVVGAPNAAACSTTDPAGQGRGAAYVIDCSTWKSDCLSPASGALGVLFGWSVATAGDRIVVGAPWDQSISSTDPNDPDDPVLGVGAAYLFEQTQLGWASRAYLKASRIEPSAFGFFLRAEAHRLAIGAYIEPADGADGVRRLPDGGEPLSGAAYVFPVAD